MLEFVWFETFFCNRKNVSVRAKNGGFEFGHFEFSTKTRIWPLLKSLFVQNKTLSDEKNVSHRPRYRIDKKITENLLPFLKKLTLIFKVTRKNTSTMQQFIKDKNWTLEVGWSNLRVAHFLFSFRVESRVGFINFGSKLNKLVSLIHFSTFRVKIWICLFRAKVFFTVVSRSWKVN